MYDMKAYYESASVEDAVRLRIEHPEAHIIAGGSDVLVQMREGKRAGVELIERPYPSSSGEPVRAFEVVGAAVFRSERSSQALLSLTALRRMTQDWLDEGARGIWRDGAQWLPPLGSTEAGGTLRRLLGQAVRAIAAGEMGAREAELGIRAAMRALR